MAKGKEAAIAVQVIIEPVLQCVHLHNEIHIPFLAALVCNNWKKTNTELPSTIIQQSICMEKITLYNRLVWL